MIDHRLPRTDENMSQTCIKQDVSHHGLAVRREAFTLIELMVVIAIIAVLTSIAIVATSAARNAMKKTTAQQQLELIANAIEQYASFWPRWEVGGVVVAEQGWPDFIPGRLFATGQSGPFALAPAFNNHVTFDIDGPDSGISYDPSGDMVVDEGDVDHAGETLYYALSAASGKGPYMTDEMRGDLQETHPDDTYPGLAGSSGKLRSKFVDPWGTPFRYFWVYRHAETSSNQKAFKGFLPVDYGAFLPGIGSNGGVNNPAFAQQGVGNARQTAVGFVIESAGPDKKFGNVWKINPTQMDIDRADDNLVKMVP